MYEIIKKVCVDTLRTKLTVILALPEIHIFPENLFHDKSSHF